MITKEMLIECAVRDVKEWPNGKAFFMNSRVENRLDFHDEGSDPMTTFTDVSVECNFASDPFDAPYIAVTKEEWEKARAIR